MRRAIRALWFGASAAGLGLLVALALVPGSVDAQAGSVPLFSGSNLVVYDGPTAPVDVATASIGGKLSAVWSFDNATEAWLRWAAGLPASLQTLSELTRGEPYFVVMSVAAVWSFASGCGAPELEAIGAFVFVTSPPSGESVSSGFTVDGCSRTFESTVNWRLLDRSGAEIAAGFTMGGGVDGPGSFSFTVAFSISAEELGHLEVFEVDASGGEGFPPPQDVVPLILEP